VRRYTARYSSFILVFLSNHTPKCTIVELGAWDRQRDRRTEKLQHYLLHPTIGGGTKTVQGHHVNYGHHLLNARFRCDRFDAP